MEIIYGNTLADRIKADMKEKIDDIMSLNLDSEVDGILVQMPLPSHLDETAALELIDPQKDVDGYTP